MTNVLVPGRVLVVDDEPYVRDMLRSALATMGAEVVTAANGAQALETVPTFQPDVILVDMMMPGLNGWEVRDAIRRTGVTVPIILISGNEIAAREGFFDVLEKPFDLQKLAQIVTAAIAHGRSERS